MHRNIHTANDVLNEETISSRLSKDHFVANNAAPYLKNSEENSKESDQKKESYARIETRISPLSTMEEKSQPPLSTYHSVNAQIGSARVSASLPRSYQSTDTARLTSVVTPRPFGVHSRGISSLPRSFTVKLFIYFFFINMLLQRKMSCIKYLLDLMFKIQEGVSVFKI